MPHRSLIAALFAIVTLVHCAPSGAQSYPSRPLRWIVPYPAGGGSDFIARTIGTQLSANLGQPVVVENKPGAGTIIAAETTAKAAPDGYTLMSADNGSLVFNAALYSKLPYDPIRDLAPVSMIARIRCCWLPILRSQRTTCGSFWRARDVIRAS